MKLKVLSFGIATGLVWGAIIFLATAISHLKHAGRTLILLVQYYPGFEISWRGAVVGLGWGFVSGLVAGALLALIYNLLSREKAK